MEHLFKHEIDNVKSQKKKGSYVDTITLEERIKERRFTVKDIGVHYRWIDHWHTEGLLIGNYEQRKWRKFNLIEYVWLKIIIKMREFNLSLETVRSVKEILETDITGVDFLKLDDNSLIEIIPKVAPSDMETVTRNFLKEQEIQEKIKQFHIKLIELYIMDILTLYSYHSILINSHGEIVPIKYSYIELYSDKIEFKNFITKSYVSISITEILREFILEKDIDINNAKRIAILTDEESIVLKTIRQDDLKSVLIKFDKNKKINLLEDIKEKKIDKVVRLFELIMAKGYQDITIKTQNGEIVYCENKTKKMI